MALTKTPIELSSTPSIVDGGNATAITIDSSENVGIGVSPATTLDVKGASDLVASFRSSTNNGNTSEAKIRAVDSDSSHVATFLFQGYEHRFQNASGTERMRISSNGNTSITATSFHPLSLDRAGQDTAGQVSVAANGTVQAYWGSNSSALLRVSNSSFTQKMLVDHSGNLTTAGSVNSDRDLKENINDIPDGSLALIQQLQPRTFNFLESFGFGTESRTGFIAQEVADVFTTDNRVVTGTDGESNMGVDPLGVIAHLTKAVQELKEELNTATARITELENN